MGGKQITNIAASVKDKLLTVARKNNRDFNLVFRQFVQERFLYRLGISAYSGNFILKGALLFLAFDISRLRPTKDIDFMGTAVNNDIEEMKLIFREIVTIEAPDGLEFDPESISLEYIKEDDKYNGLRVIVTSRLGTVKQNLQVDIGFGDVISNGPIEINYPGILNFPEPVILAYSIESAIAEKFEAIVSLGFTTSRMKDFYDILFFANSHSFNSENLLQAIKLTFSNRGTDLGERSLILKDSFKTDKNKQLQWTAFTNKNKLETEKTFETAVDKIQSFIEPLFAMNSRHYWNPELREWQSLD